MSAPVFVGNGIYTISSFLTPEECQALIAHTEALGYDEAPVTTRRGPVMMKEVRNNTRVMVDDVPEAQRLWKRLAPMYPKGFPWPQAPIGLNERLRFYRYAPGQRFKPHRDGSYRRPNGEWSQVTFMVYLNGGFEGGATRFLDGDGCTVVPEEGKALLFAHMLMHEGAAVTSGCKYVLRSDVMYPAMTYGEG
ncbi:MAG: 2OG-Fe(II) oxygenase [Myxococcota bacterium]